MEIRACRTRGNIPHGEQSKSNVCAPEAGTRLDHIGRRLYSEWRGRLFLSPAPSRRRMRRVYLDHNATTPVAPEVLAAMLPYFSEEYGNASSIHTFGQRARGAVEEARESVAALLGARPAEIMFSSGGTESNNHAIFGVAGAASGGRKHVITSAIEHSAVLDPCRALEKRGVAVTFLPVDRDGVVNPEDIRRAIRPETVLITIMLANNELGTIEPIAEIGKIAAEAR